MTTAATDGRKRRRERNREAIIVALVELVRAGDVAPTAEAIARRARLQTRTVFRHFADLASLYAEGAARVRAEVVPGLLAPLQRGRPAARVRAFVRARTTAYEHVAPFFDAGSRLRTRYAFVRANQARTARQLRMNLVAALPEFADAPAPALAAFELVTSIEAWTRLRGHQELPRGKALAVMTLTALALLPALQRRG